MFKFSSLLVASLFLFACMPRSEVAVRSAGGRKRKLNQMTIITPDTPTSSDSKIPVPGSLSAKSTKCLTDLSASDKRVINCDGISYNVSISDACLGGNCGLVFDVHGWTMNGDKQNANTGLAELGAEKQLCRCST